MLQHWQLEQAGVEGDHFVVVDFAHLLQALNDYVDRARSFLRFEEAMRAFMEYGKFASVYPTVHVDKSLRFHLDVEISSNSPSSWFYDPRMLSRRQMADASFLACRVTKEPLIRIVASLKLASQPELPDEVRQKQPPTSEQRTQAFFDLMDVLAQRLQDAYPRAQLS